MAIQITTTHKTVAVPAAGTALLLPVNGNRIYGYIHNPSTSALHIYLGAYDSTSPPGIILYQYDTFIINPDEPWLNAVIGYCADAINVYVTESGLKE